MLLLPNGNREAYRLVEKVCTSLLTRTARQDSSPTEPPLWESGLRHRLLAPCCEHTRTPCWLCITPPW